VVVEKSDSYDGRRQVLVEWKNQTFLNLRLN
jgi:hypothetical protein